MITPEDLAKSGTEDGHQMALFNWAQQNTNTYPQLRWMFAIPNGGYRDKITAGKLKATGVKSGVPDICLPVSKLTTLNFGLVKGFAALYIELKRPMSHLKKAGKISDEQLEWINFLISQGYRVEVCYGWEQARDVIINYLEGKNRGNLK